MIFLPDIFFLRQIREQNVYYDKKSTEKETGITKRKYKLAGDIFSPLNIYAFFLLTTNSASNKATSITVLSGEWENKKDNYLCSTSYINVCKNDILSKEDLLIKMRDLENRFLPVAKLSDNKYIEFKNLRSKAHSTDKGKDLKELAIIDLALGKSIEHINKDILKELGL